MSTHTISSQRLVMIDKGVVEILTKEYFAKIGPMNCVTLRETKSQKEISSTAITLYVIVSL